MKRLTEHRDNGVILVDCIKQKESAIHRLAAIEDILGDDYDLDRLRELVEADHDGRCFITGRPYPVTGKAADVAPVVRCRECALHSEDAATGKLWCTKPMGCLGCLEVKPDDFCSRGKRH